MAPPCRALVTGASSGIGAALADVLAREGWDLVLVARNAEVLERTASRLRSTHGSNVRVQALDLAVPDAPATLFRALEADGVPIDLLVNNAGIGDYGFFHEASWDRSRDMINLNVLALVHLTRLLLPGMVARRSGRILNIASTAAFQPGPLMSVYYASKAFVLFFSEAIEREVRGTGVTVTAYCPGPVHTNFQVAASVGESRLARNRPVPGPGPVAEDAYRAALQGRPVKIQGRVNALGAFAMRLLPRSWAVEIAWWNQQGRR